jgi:hypothetical protein
MDLFPGPFRHLANDVLSDLITAFLVAFARLSLLSFWNRSAHMDGRSRGRFRSKVQTRSALCRSSAPGFWNPTNGLRRQAAGISQSLTGGLRPPPRARYCSVDGAG